MARPNWILRMMPPTSTGDHLGACHQPVIVTAPMRKDFGEYDVFEMYKPGATEIRMIHGTADEVIDPEAAKRFAEKFNIDITWVQGGDHRLSIPGAEDKVMALAKEFFLG